MWASGYEYRHLHCASTESARLSYMQRSGLFDRLDSYIARLIVKGTDGAAADYAAKGVFGAKRHNNGIPSFGIHRPGPCFVMFETAS